MVGLIVLLVVIFISVLVIYLAISSAVFSNNKNVRRDNPLVKFIARHKKLYRITKFLTIVVCLGLLIGYYIYTLPTNSDADKYTDSYIQNSTDIELVYLTPNELNAINEFYRAMKYAEVSEQWHEAKSKYNDTRHIYTGARFVGRRSKIQSVDYRLQTFKDHNTNRYFRIAYVVQRYVQKAMYDAILKDNVIIQAKVNMSELNNPNMGTIENPIPIMMFHIPSREGSDDYNENKITEEQYRQNVYYYLAYIMSKEEFKKRFEK